MSVTRRPGPCALLGMMAGALVALAQGPQPTATSPSDTDAALGKCMEHCRSTFTSIEQTLRLIDEAQSAVDSPKAREKLVRARAQLLDMRQQMSRCMSRLEHLRTGAVSDPQASAAISRTWACPMHPQVHQDRPGNCPICDAALKPVGEVSTQPAVAEKPGEDAANAPFERTAGR